MKSNQCIPQTISKFMMGMIFLGAAIAFAVLGITLLPIIGFILAAPVLALAFYFFRVHLNDQCEIEV